VKVLGEAIGRSEKIDEVLRDVERFDGADAEPFDRGFAENAAEEIFEFDAWRKIASVGAEVDAANNDFAVSRFAEVLDFPDDCFGRQAAAFATDEGDHAVGAARVAAVLDLKAWAGVIPFPPRTGAERNSVRSSMLPVRILPRWGAACCAPTKEWNGAVESTCKAAAGKKVGRRFRGRGG